MEAVLDFVMAALPWLTMGLMLAIFAARENSRKNNPEKEDFEVLEVLRKGYVYKGKVIRAAEVIINRI